MEQQEAAVPAVPVKKYAKQYRWRTKYRATEAGRLATREEARRRYWRNRDAILERERQRRVEKKAAAAAAAAAQAEADAAVPGMTASSAAGAEGLA